MIGSCDIGPFGLSSFLAYVPGHPRRLSLQDYSKIMSEYHSFCIAFWVGSHLSAAVEFSFQIIQFPFFHKTPITCVRIFVAQILRDFAIPHACILSGQFAQ